MNVTGTRDDEIAHYIAAVEDALSDLPPHVRGELIGDLIDHLTEVAGEITTAVPLATRLGPPEAYASELRSTLPTTADTGARMPQPAFAGTAMVAAAPPSTVDWHAVADRADGFLGELFAYRRATDMLYALRPGWWVARALILSVGLALFLMGDFYFYVQDSPVMFVAAAFTFAAVVLSIRLGRKTSPAARFTGTAVNLFTVPVLVIAVLHELNPLWAF
ncbi:HAAS signaling domain-containing protein [Phytomonospora endophytica]|uniref:Uncharacterized protein n=1 Tax=Phytomonospora endophytica TaxID=714109 RepID=A0A841G5B4_9ACTN|nr:hypothetical protein [Phytomonospora endophytica]MBB6039290.1 hypothetical protein [Phytomonospora endophytica]GIG69768.1 hypothetical protein Pen01_60630 [Phytomonospora endophytica]